MYPFNLWKTYRKTLFRHSFLFIYSIFVTLLIFMIVCRVWCEIFAIFPPVLVAEAHRMNERKMERERPQREYCVWMFFLFSLVAKTTHFKGTVLPKSVNLWYSKRFVELFAKAYRSNNPECNGNGCSCSISAVTRTTFIDFKSQFHIRSRLNT